MTEVSLSVSHYCGYCHNPITNAKTCVQACGTTFHKECFVCQSCHVRLFSFSKFIEDKGKPICATCHANKNNPTCFICKKLIEGNYTLAGPQEFKVHDHCFKCNGCGLSFTSETGFTEDEGKFWHLSCLR
eukprot:TRINITY_DN3338_c0_g1_i1.p1 TRINITY_DN3338_c0_g1~~TRINITY_DN3338_c0_g1_i1.p1  ORF type:complete len:145 (+),score=13.89 TRINITY_DN3338_c0_g1_i1:47-436(+)